MYPIVYFKLTSRSTVIFLTRKGIRLIIRTSTNSSDIHVFTEVWLEKEYSIPSFEIDENDVIIDIGAHIGIFSVFASQFCKNGIILCYEPTKDNYSVLTDNVKNNSIKNIFCYNKAVSGKNQMMKFYLSRDDLAAHSLYKKSEEWLEVESITIKEIFDNNKLEKCDFLKMDCEGAEYEILMTLPENYFAKINKICLEYHNMKEISFTVEDLVEILQSHNFLVQINPISEKTGFLYAKRKVITNIK